MNERQKLILELMWLAYLVDQNTDYCVFIRFSGHVQEVNINIRQSKKNYNTKLIETSFYQDHLDDEESGYLKAKKDHLVYILKEGEIDYDSMDVEIEEIEHHYF